MGLKWASILTHPHLWTMSGKRTKCCSSRFLAYLQKTSPDLSRGVGGGLQLSADDAGHPSFTLSPIYTKWSNVWVNHYIHWCSILSSIQCLWAPSIPWMICRARGMNSCNFRTPAGHGKFDGQVVKTHLLIRRPRPLPRQGRRLGPPEVWNLALGSQAKAHAIKATPLSATCPRHLFFRGLRLPFARPQSPQTLPTLPQASKATTLTATTCPCHLFFRGFRTAVCPPSNPPNASNPLAGLQGNNSYSYMPLPSVFQGVQDCRLPALKPPKRFRRPPRQQLLYSYMPLPSVFQGVQDCRLPALKPPKRFQPSRRPPRQQLLQLHAPAICFSGGSRLPFARPQTPQTLPKASKATTLTATCLCHLFFRGFKTAVCPPSNPPNASNPPAGLQGNNSDS